MATLAAFSIIVRNVQARTQNACDIFNTKKLSYLPKPKQAQATQGVLPLSGGAGFTTGIQAVMDLQWCCLTQGEVVR